MLPFLIQLIYDTHKKKKLIYDIFYPISDGTFFTLFQMASDLI